MRFLRKTRALTRKKQFSFCCHETIEKTFEESLERFEKERNLYKKLNQIKLKANRSAEKKKKANI